MRSRHLAFAALAAGLTIGCGGSGGASPSLDPTASVVIGQPDMGAASPNQGGAISAAGLHFPVGDASFAGGRLLLPDTFNHRLLEYAGLPAASGAAATAPWGQADATSGAPSLAPARYHYPRSVWSDGSRVVVADAGASRVQILDGASTVSLGWGGAAAYRTGCGADLLAEPWRAIVAGGKLIVVDRANHRVLVWATVPATSTPATLVIGQQDLTHCAPNDALGVGRAGGRSGATLSSPTDAWSDGRRLLVADQGNNRILLWNEFPTTNGAPADVVLGQADFHTAVSEASRTGLSGPGFVASDGRRIFAADVRNNRVLGWSAFPQANAAPADLVLGQRDWVHRAPNDDDQDGATDQATARTLHTPMGVAIAGSSLIVTDTGNHRYLVYSRR